MLLRGTDFGHVLCSSGARGFFGDGYWWHGPLRPLGLDWSGSTFVAKTTTLRPRAGNMELREDGVTPARLRPDCVRVRWIRGTVLNAVGLSGPGALRLLSAGRWQRIRDPFFISFMSVEPAPGDRIAELREFVSLLGPQLPGFSAPVGIEINLSCPNAGVDYGRSLVQEAMDAVDAASGLGVPIVPNFGPDVPVEVVRTVAGETACDAVSVANTVGWGRIPELIDWEGSWGRESPLARYGGGGISGAPLRKAVLAWASRASELGLPKPLIMGGGILSSRDAEALLELGVDAVKLGTVAFLRPWRVRGIIRRVRSLRGRAF